MTGSVSSSDTNRQTRARALVVRAVFAGALLGALISFFAGDFERRLAFDSMQQLAPRDISQDNVAVVLIDDESVAEGGSWPWPRYQMAQLIELIGRSDPAAIGIDIYFIEPDPVRPEAFAKVYLEEELDPATRAAVLALPNMDNVFADVLGTQPSVMARVAIEDAGVDADEIFFNTPVEGTPPPGTLATQRIFTSIPELDLAALGQGVVNGQPDGDGVVRRVPLSMQVGSGQAPGFALEIARVALGEESLRWQDGRLMLGERALPADTAGNFAFKMGYNSSVPQYSALQLFRGELPADVFAGKAVLVGVGATGTYDIVATPLQSEVDGVLVQAMAVDAMIEGQWLTRPSSMVLLEAFAALALAGLVLAAGWTGRNWLLWVALGSAALIPVGALAAYTGANLLFDPVRPLIVAATAAIALVATRYALARAERARLASELVEERVRASEQRGELEAARRIQMSMVPGEKVLSRLDHRADIAGVLEPAKSVGGDFFDAVKVSDDLLLFLVGDVTGKGVPAALFMALSKTLSKSNLARAGDGLEAAVCALNFDLMDEADEEMGLTMLVGTLDCSTGDLQLINAGHENPMVVRASGEVETLAMRGGPPFCVIDFPYSAESFRLDAGETLVVISDGATEAANERDELFGVEGVVAALAASADGTAPGRAAHLAASVRAFEGESDASDDLTIFTLRFLGPQERSDH